VHTGVAFFGTVSGAEGLFSDFTALGDSVNTAARLVSLAEPGEALISDVAYAASNLPLGPLPKREIVLRGKEDPTVIRVWRPRPKLQVVESFADEDG
jgi:adenylate cyclase